MSQIATYVRNIAPAAPGTSSSGASTDSTAVVPHRSGGYNLLQMAFAMIVLGLLTVGFIQIYHIYKTQQDYMKTQEGVASAVQKLQTYKQSHGYYPCPAPNVARGATGYGNVSSCDGTIPAGTCAGGICVQSSTRGALGTIKVRVGVIPFRDLQMDEKETFDAYGSRLTYALTEDMGKETTFNIQKGGIEIVNEAGQPLTDPPKSAAFLVLSHGPNKIGAYAALTAAQPVPCPASTANQLDAENCLDPAAPDPNAKFINTLRSDGTGPLFDDVLEYFASAGEGLWTHTTAIAGDNIVNIRKENVGIGAFSSFSPPPSLLSIQQTTVDTTTGRILTPNAAAGTSGALATSTDAAHAITASSICTLTSGKCYQLQNFKTSVATSPSPLTNCNYATGDYPVGITSDGTKAVALCGEVAFRCPPGQVLTGMVNSGFGTLYEPQCGTATPVCPAQTSTVCGHSVSLQSSINVGTTQSLPDPAAAPGTCGTATWSCAGGNWVKDSSLDTPARCNNDPISSASCGPGYSGTYSTFACGGTSSSTSCTCTGIALHTVTETCASPFTGGSTTKSCESKCVGGVLQQEVCSNPTGSCTCDLTNKVEFDDCPAGYKRKDSPTPASFPSSSWPSDPKKGKYRNMTIDTGTCTYNDPAFDDSNCECDPRPIYEAVLKNPSDYPTVNPDYVVHEACYKAKEGARDVTDGGTLALAGVNYGYAVMKTPKKSDCTPDTSAKSEFSAATFVPRYYHWKSSTAPLITNQSDRGTTKYELDTGCNCQSTGGAKATCYKSIGNSKYDIYACECKGD